MRWLIILNGKHWVQVSPVIFHEHHNNADWCMTLCDAFDAGGAMIELTRGDTKYYVPHGSVVSAVYIKSPKTTMGFIDPAAIEKDAAST